MDLSVVVVSYNVVALLEQCLCAILDDAPPDCEVFVVDNASTDGSAALVRDRYPAVRLIANERNVGFGTAVNQAIRASHGRFVAIVNPDAIPQPGSIEAFARFLQSHPQAAMVGGRLCYPDGSFQENAFRFPTLAQIFLDFLPLNWRLTQSVLNGRYPRSWDKRTFQIDSPLGAFLCVRRSACDRVGLFDERYFMYAEELDWAFRFRHAGWEIWHCPEAVAVHHGGRSTRQRAAAMFVELQRSRQRFYRKHYSKGFVLAARAITWLGLAKTAAVDLIEYLKARNGQSERLEHARACLAAMWL